MSWFNRDRLFEDTIKQLRIQNSDLQERLLEQHKAAEAEREKLLNRILSLSDTAALREYNRPIEARNTPKPIPPQRVHWPGYQISRRPPSPGADPVVITSQEIEDGEQS